MPNLKQLSVFADAWLPAWLFAFAVFAVIVALGLRSQRAVTRLLAVRPPGWQPFLRQALRRTRNLVRFMLALFAAAMALPLVHISAAFRDDLHRVFVALFLVQLGWVAIVVANIAIDRYVYGFNLDTADNLLARKAVTQMRIVRQAVNVMLGMFTVGFALMSFDSVRQFGVSLFASAGVAGIVAGMAARPLLENLLAGLQLAFTQPLRMGDAVVINNEFGTVEEITSVYIVVRLWDLRRQVVPLSYIFTNPFLNWTRASASIISSVFFFFDYMVNVDAFRAEADRLVRTSSFWDGKVISTQVIDTTEQTMKVRVLVSAGDSGRASDLSAFMRERLIAFVRDRYPAWLPRSRQEALAERVRLPPGGGEDRLAPGPPPH